MFAFFGPDINVTANFDSLLKKFSLSLRKMILYVYCIQTKLQTNILLHLISSDSLFRNGKAIKMPRKSNVKERPASEYNIMTRKRASIAAAGATLTTTKRVKEVSIEKANKTH